MVILEGIKGLGTPVSALYPRYQYLNPEIITRHPSPQVIILASHQNNWEWGALTLPQGIHKEVLGVYKPLSNPIADAWLNKERGKHGLHLVPMAHTRSKVTQALTQSMEFALVLIADQTPSNMNSAHFTTFLNQPDTPFSPGPDLIARSTGFPVFYAQVRRLKPGYYTIRFELLEDQPARLQAGDITRKYVEALEQDLLDDPANWLWSHARWKHKRPSPATGFTVAR
jgi:KDO2-lipid IV(A) lauroyltransferase